ncbi:MAG: hypothetical protein RR063_06705, partial [Anaerovoracaceae bacterium]
RVGMSFAKSYFSTAKVTTFFWHVLCEANSTFYPSSSLAPKPVIARLMPFYRVGMSFAKSYFSTAKVTTFFWHVLCEANSTFCLPISLNSSVKVACDLLPSFGTANVENKGDPYNIKIALFLFFFVLKCPIDFYFWHQIG